MSNELVPEPPVEIMLPEDTLRTVRQLLLAGKDPAAIATLLDLTYADVMSAFDDPVYALAQEKYEESQAKAVDLAKARNSVDAMDVLRQIMTDGEVDANTRAKVAIDVLALAGHSTKPKPAPTTAIQVNTATIDERVAKLLKK